MYNVPWIPPLGWNTRSWVVVWPATSVTGVVAVIHWLPDKVDSSDQDPGGSPRRLNAPALSVVVL